MISAIYEVKKGIRETKNRKRRLDQITEGSALSV
jgi:hypothetical protein